MFWTLLSYWQHMVAQHFQMPTFTGKLDWPRKVKFDRCWWRGSSVLMAQPSSDECGIATNIASASRGGWSVRQNYFLDIKLQFLMAAQIFIWFSLKQQQELLEWLLTIGAITWNQPGRDDLPQQWPWSLHDCWGMLPTIPRLWFHIWWIFRCLQKNADLVMLFWCVSKLPTTIRPALSRPCRATRPRKMISRLEWAREMPTMSCHRAICVLELRYEDD